MNVLSLFDGISSGRVALQRANIPVDTYYASEIDKYAIKIAQKNFPDTIQLGDITQVKGVDLPKIDLLIGGSPCQGFSFAGKQLNFEDVRSKLFFEYVRLLKECRPTYFLLENVAMKKEYQDVITSYLGVEPVFIDSALFSAQTRKRLYWTNIPIAPLPDGSQAPNLQDILEKDVDEKYWVKPKRPITTTPKSKRKWGYIGSDSQANRIYKTNGKAVTLTGLGGGLGTKMGMYHIPHLNKATIVGRRLDENGHRQDYDKNIPITQCLEVRATNTNKSNCLTTVTKDNVITTLPIGRYPNAFEGDYSFRILTPVECERLQTIEESYTEGISNSQRYKCLGNGWTVDVVAHIFRGIKKEEE